LQIEEAAKSGINILDPKGQKFLGRENGRLSGREISRIAGDNMVGVAANGGMKLQGVFKIPEL
jgi:hypothetical protein